MCLIYVLIGIPKRQGDSETDADLSVNYNIQMNSLNGFKPKKRMVLMTTLKEERKQADGAFGIRRVMTSDEVDG